MKLSRSWWFVGGLLAFVVLGGVSFPPSPILNSESLTYWTKIMLALLGCATAVTFAYSDSEPVSKNGDTLEKRRRRRDRAKLFTHGSVIGIAIFVLYATITRQI